MPGWNLRNQVDFAIDGGLKNKDGMMDGVSELLWWLSVIATTFSDEVRAFSPVRDLFMSRAAENSLLTARAIAAVGAVQWIATLLVTPAISTGLESSPFPTLTRSSSQLGVNAASLASDVPN